MRLALDSLRAHKLRSFLTLLGVILAVTTLVVVMSVIEGLNFYIADKVANLGANVLVIDRFGIITSEDQWVKAQKRPIITAEDYQRFRASAKLPKAVAGYDRLQAQTRSGDQILENTAVIGVTANYAEVRGLNIAQGRFLTEADDEHRSEVAFIGDDLAKKFFSNVDPIGKTIRSETHTYEVIGVGAPIGSALGRSQDNYMLLPLGTFQKGWHKPNDSMAIFVQAPNGESMQSCEDEARMLFRAWHHLQYDDADDFGVLGSESIMSLWRELTGNLAKVAMALVSVFLVVGGIVIMNIMLVSVTERTREIGIRKALGARRFTVLLQILVEAVMLAFLGGALGIGIGAILTVILGKVFELTLHITVTYVALAIVVSTTVGVVSGWYPASRASKLDPIEALRSE